MEDYNQWADVVKIYNCEQKMIKYAILKFLRFAEFELINFFSNSNALFRNGSVSRFFVLTYDWFFMQGPPEYKEKLWGRCLGEAEIRS